MADKTCPQCAETILRDAKVCRFCGHAFPEQPTRPASKPRAGCLKIAGIFFALVLGTRIIVALTGWDHPKVGGASITPTEIASASPSSSSSNDLGGMAMLAGESLKKAARDPESLVIERAFGRTEKHGLSYVCVLYRARNGFGGMSRDHAVFSLVGGDQTAHAWNKWCTGLKDFEDLTGTVKTGASLSPI